MVIINYSGVWGITMNFHEDGVVAILYSRYPYRDEEVEE
jgi:hypothetical protein